MYIYPKEDSSVFNNTAWQQWREDPLSKFSLFPLNFLRAPVLIKPAREIPHGSSVFIPEQIPRFPRNWTKRLKLPAWIFKHGYFLFRLLYFFSSQGIFLCICMSSPKQDVWNNRRLTAIVIRAIWLANFSQEAGFSRVSAVMQYPPFLSHNPIEKC